MNPAEQYNILIQLLEDLNTSITFEQIEHSDGMHSIIRDCKIKRFSRVMVILDKCLSVVQQTVLAPTEEIILTKMKYDHAHISFDTRN